MIEKINLKFAEKEKKVIGIDSEPFPVLVGAYMVAPNFIALTRPVKNIDMGKGHLRQ